MSSFGVVPDADVLFAASIRDTLLRAAAEGLYRLHWSDEILDEVRRNLVSRSRTNEQQAQHLVDQMRGYFPEASVTGYEELIGAMKNDRKDRHVLATAVVSRSQVIVTNNLRHFPDDALTPFSIEAQSPDEFLCHLFDLYEDTMVRIILDQNDSLNAPPLTLEQMIRQIALMAPSFATLIWQKITGQSALSTQ
jgi:predicted nucleic acid-binding protein